MAFRQEGNGEPKTLLDWLKRHPGVRVRAVLPIVQDGQTVALHLWYDGPDMGDRGRRAIMPPCPSPLPRRNWQPSSYL